MLPHFYEELFAAMVNRQRLPFLNLTGLLPRSDPAIVGGAANLAFSEVRLAAFGGRQFDGTSRVDAIVRLQPHLATPFELKLGGSRLGKDRVDNEWLVDCGPSDHRDPRWKGNMIAILDRRFSTPIEEDLIALIDNESLVLTREWFIVARKAVIEKWRVNPPRFSNHVRYLAFEDIVNNFGDKSAFNSLVREQFDIDYHALWT